MSTLTYILDPSIADPPQLGDHFKRVDGPEANLFIGRKSNGIQVQLFNKNKKKGITCSLDQLTDVIELYCVRSLLLIEYAKIQPRYANAEELVDKILGQVDVTKPVSPLTTEERTEAMTKIGVLLKRQGIDAEEYKKRVILN